MPSLVLVDWYIQPENDADLPAYRTCDLCYRSATDDAIAGKSIEEFRQFFREDCECGISICEHCLQEYLR